MEHYTYRPKRFYIIVFALTWGFWALALALKNNNAAMLGIMVVGLIMPAATAVVTVLTSKNKMLKEDLKRKIVGFYRIKPKYILLGFLLYGVAVAASIGISVLFGGSPDQFSFTEDFSFSIGGTSALLTMLLASVIEEVGWRGYGEDAVGQYHSWFVESLIFAGIWGCWHLPLFLIPGTYQYTLKELGLVYVINFLLSTFPVDFLQTWLYVKNRRSMLATILFHLFINIMQEKIAMTPETKIIETGVLTLVVVGVVLANKKLFFEKEHVGRLLEMQLEEDAKSER
ncbi:MAG: CPBP family intramembrane metalloprotease [Lachnospiraceae bacterium]|jgi:membrane protease YdiL (CAAX protease family)|nr:CPBP family intramembrane metalloprotease [Lachnospiraceae bacterium]